MQDSDRFLIESWRIGYSESDASCLLDALRWCFDRQLPIPPWVREGLLAAIDRVGSGKASSWDEVFGSAEALQTESLGWAIAFQVARVIKDQGILKRLDFEAIGRKVKPPVGATAAKNAYYKYFKKSARRSIHPLKSSKKSR